MVTIGRAGTSYIGSKYRDYLATLRILSCIVSSS
jgi:hypothetical protein